jgi:hypothetical protein
MFQEGDKYIHFTKRGSINKGVVKTCDIVKVIDTINNVSYDKIYMVNEKGIHYQLDGTDGQFYKISQEFSDEESKNIGEALLKIAELKNARREKVMSKFKKTKKKSLKDSNLDDLIKDTFDDNNIS